MCLLFVTATKSVPKRVQNADNSKRNGTVEK